MIKNKRCGVLLVILLFVGSVSLAQTSDGLVTRINLKTKLVESDLPGKGFEIGEIVEIERDGNVLGFLEVIDNQDTLKLTVMSDPGLNMANFNFDQLKAGDRIVKLTALDREPIPGQAPMVASQQPKDSVNERLNQLGKDYAVLSNHINQLMKEKNSLEVKQTDTSIQLEKALQRVDQLQNENLALQESIKHDQLQVMNLNKENKRCFSENDQLKAQLKGLKDRMLVIEKLVDKGLGTHDSK